MLSYCSKTLLNEYILHTIVKNIAYYSTVFRTLTHHLPILVNGAAYSSNDSLGYEELTG